MIIKGGDVEQLIMTPYAQPYVQIVRQNILRQIISDTNSRPTAVLQRYGEYFREYSSDSASLRSVDVWHHQPSHNNLAPAMVLRS